MICDLLQVRTEVDYGHFLHRNQYPFKRHETRQQRSFPQRVLLDLVKRIAATGRPPHPQANCAVTAIFPPPPRFCLAGRRAATVPSPLPCYRCRRHHAATIAAATLLPSLLCRRLCRCVAAAAAPPLSLSCHFRCQVAAAVAKLLPSPPCCCRFRCHAAAAGQLFAALRGQPPQQRCARGRRNAAGSNRAAGGRCRQ